MNQLEQHTRCIQHAPKPTLTQLGLVPNTGADWGDAEWEYCPWSGDNPDPKQLADVATALLTGRADLGDLLLGPTQVTLWLLASLLASGLDRAIEAVYTRQADQTCPALTVPVGRSRH
jgi:hypothetical protein